MAKSKRNVSVSVNPDAERSFPLSMCLCTESGLEIQFADRLDTKTETKVIVREIVKIPANEMKVFAMDVIDALIDYEKEYKNGLGFVVPEKEDVDASSDEKGAKMNA